MTLALIAFFLGSLALVALVSVYLYFALQAFFFGAEPSGPPAGLLLAFVVIAVGLLVGLLSLLLRFSERERYDGRPPPSLVPALIIIALGVALGCVSVGGRSLGLHSLQSGGHSGVPA